MNPPVVASGGVGGGEPALGAAGPADALVRADWSRVLFMHYAIAPEVLRSHVPPSFELEEYDGSAWVTLVALTMSGFRPHHRAPWWSGVFPWVREQRFFNVRTYVRREGEPGAYFLWGWLSRPWGLPWTTAGLGLPCAFATIEYQHPRAAGAALGEVRSRGGRFVYRAEVEAGQGFRPCAAGSLERFALERYAGFFSHGGKDYRFEASHGPWLGAEARMEVEDRGLVDRMFPWFARAQLAGAHYAPGVPDVWIGRPLRLALPSIGAPFDWRSLRLALRASPRGAEGKQ